MYVYTHIYIYICVRVCVCVCVCVCTLRVVEDSEGQVGVSVSAVVHLCKGLGCRVLRSGFRVQGSGFRN